MKRWILTILVAAACTVLLAAPAAAHDELVGSAPADGYTVTQLPATATLTFAEETAPDDVTVKVGGRALPVSASPTDPHAVVVDLSGVPATKTVRLVWRAVDAHDGHVTTGAVAFHVLAHEAVAPPTPQPTPGFSSVPADGFTVTNLPAQARLTFPTKVAPASVTVVVSGVKRGVTALAGDPHTVVVDLVGVRATESVTLLWTLGNGEHANRGQVTFHVLDHVQVGAGTTTRRPAPPLHALSVTTHVVGYLATAVLLGGLFFISVLWPEGARDRRTRRVLVAATFTGGAAATTAVYVAIRQVAPLPFRDAVAQHFGRVSVTLALMWLLAVVVVVSVLQLPDSVRRPAWRVGAAVVAVGLIRATGMSAHGTQGTDATFGVLADFLHLCAVSAWIGGLVVLLVGLLPRRQPDELERVLPRFSKVAATSVVLVVASGTILAVRILGSVGALFETHYGHLLLVKLALVGLVLIAALGSKRWVEQTLSGGVMADRGRGVGSFFASVSAETAIVVTVLGVASLLVTSNPGM